MGLGDAGRPLTHQTLLLILIQIHCVMKSVQLPAFPFAICLVSTACGIEGNIIVIDVMGL